MNVQSTPAIYIPTADELEQSRRFAETHDDRYDDCGQDNADKKVQDKLLSKLSEFIVQRACIESGCEIVRGVDTRVLDVRRRSHDPDLVVRRGPLVTPLSIKLCPAITTRRYGTSWTYQYSPRPDPVFFSDQKAGRREILVVETAAGGFYIAGKFFARELLPLMREPRLEYLRKHKRVIYQADLPQ